MSKKVIILGGDGFCGWPTALHLSNCGHDILIVDNFSRRRIDEELTAASLTPIANLSERIEAWKRVSGKHIDFCELDVAVDYDRLLATLEDYKPDVIVHFAEQRAAPYSMKSSKHKRYTVSNNLNATHNICCAIVESGLDTHLVHLGTMGVYGYGTAGMKIPEGYLDVNVETDAGTQQKLKILYPANPGSVYHMTKTQDQQMHYKHNLPFLDHASSDSSIVLRYD